MMLYYHAQGFHYVTTHLLGGRSYVGSRQNYDSHVNINFIKAPVPTMYCQLD